MLYLSGLIYCKINKKDHWDDVHYNCAENHHSRCPILKEYQNNRNSIDF